MRNVETVEEVEPVPSTSRDMTYSDLEQKVCSDYTHVTVSSGIEKKTKKRSIIYRPVELEPCFVKLKASLILQTHL